MRSATSLSPLSGVTGWGLTGPAQLADVVHHVDVGVLLGLSTATGAFTEAIVREMAGKTERPIIFPLSNPTSRAGGASCRVGPLDRWAGFDRYRPLRSPRCTATASNML